MVRISWRWKLVENEWRWILGGNEWVSEELHVSFLMEYNLSNALFVIIPKLSFVEK